MSKTERVHGDILEYEFGSSFSLTSIINSQQNTPRSITGTLIDFFSQKIQTVQRMNGMPSDQNSQESETDFSNYLSQITSDLNHIKKKKAKRTIDQNSISDIMDLDDITKCYNQIPYIFFQKDFVLNMENYGIKDKMRVEQEELNEYLDLVQINLFSQVNHKFNDFYQALVNFQDLEHRVDDNISRLSVVRSRIPILKKQFLEKADAVSKIIQVRSNKEAVLRHLTVMRSLKKLPPTIKTILQSPLPHESLSLLSTGKSMYKIVHRLGSMKSIGDSLEKSDNVIKHSLYKSFSDKLFLYITTPLSPPFSKQFQSLSIFHQTNPNESIIQQPSVEHDLRQVSTRNPKTQEQLVATIIESYQSVDFTGGSRIKVKVMEYIKLITKQFFEELKSHLSKLIKNNNILKESTQPYPSNENLSEILQKVSMGCYSKIMLVYQSLFKSTTSRLLSTLELLHSKFVKDIANLDPQKGVPILQQLLYLLNSIFKIVCDEISQYITLKKLSREITIYEFNTYLHPLTYWIKYCKSILESSVFSQAVLPGFEMEEYKHRIVQLIQPLEQTKSKLQDAYITNLHMGVINTELKVQLEQETWESMEDINYTYFTTLNYIFNKYSGINKNVSLDPNSSFNQSFIEGTRRERNRAANHSILINKPESERQIRDIKLVKNAIILDKKRFKTTKSFLLYSQILEEYLKIQQIFPEKKTQMIERMGDIAKYFSSYSTELLVSAGALKFNMIKTRNITIKHLCLLWCNLKLLWQMLSAQHYPELNLIITQIYNRLQDVIKKMSWIICNKVESELSNLFKQRLSNSAPNQSTINIINSQKQMIEIMEQYLDEPSIKEVMAKSVDIVLKKFFQFLEDKGERGVEEGKYYVEQMKVLEISFEKEMDLMKKILKL